MIVSKLLKIMLWKLFLIRMVQFMLEYSRRGENGQGTFTYSDGRRYLGGWENGEMWNGKSIRQKPKYHCKGCEWEKDKTITPH